jgi:hypothetical protein
MSKQVQGSVGEGALRRPPGPPARPENERFYQTAGTRIEFWYRKGKEKVWFWVDNRLKI